MACTYVFPPKRHVLSLFEFELVALDYWGLSPAGSRLQSPTLRKYQAGSILFPLWKNSAYYLDME
jgi:hypothetical protein